MGGEDEVRLSVEAGRLPRGPSTRAAGREERIK